MKLARLPKVELQPVTLSRVDLQLRMLNRDELKPYQVTGAEWLMKRKRAALCDEQGTGKSAQVLRANMGRALIVVCPASLRLYWRDEAQRWCPSMRVRLDDGELRAPVPDELLIASYDSLPERPSKSAYRRVRIAFDEAQWCKGADTLRTHNARALARVAESVIVLTGTPLAGTPDDLWNVLELACLGVEAFGSRERFIEAFGGKASKNGFQWEDEPANSELITNALRSVMLRRLRKDVLPELPSKEYERIRVPVPAELVEKMSETDAAWRAIGFDRLPPFELMSEVQERLAVSRIPALLEYCSTRDEPLVVFSAHVEPVNALATMPGWGTISGTRATICHANGAVEEYENEADRKRVVDAFQCNGTVKHLALTLKVGGQGLTLTRSSHVVRVSRSYTPSDNEQCEDRVVRIGQTAEGVLITDFVSDHAIEDRLLEICAIKTALIRATVDRASVGGPTGQ